MFRGGGKQVGVCYLDLRCGNGGLHISLPILHQLISWKQVEWEESVNLKQTEVLLVKRTTRDMQLEVLTP